MSGGNAYNAACGTPIAVFTHIETVHNPKRRYGPVGDTSPVEFERLLLQRLTSVPEIRRDSGTGD